MPRFWVLLTVISVSVMALTGCGSGRDATPATTTTTSGAAWSRPDAPPDPHTLLRAGKTAIATVSGSTLVFIESQTDDAGTWKSQVVSADGTEQQVKVGVDGITVLVGPTPQNDSDADKAGRRARVQSARLDYQAAVDKVLAAVPNGSITQLSLTDSNGTTGWAADVWDTDLVEHKVTINAVSGALIENKQV